MTPLARGATVPLRPSGDGCPFPDHRNRRTDSDAGVHDRPLLTFYTLVHGRSDDALVDEQAVFNFSCVQAIADCVDTGLPQHAEMANL